MRQNLVSGPGRQNLVSGPRRQNLPGGDNPTVRANAINYRQAHGVLTLSAVTMMEITRGHQQKQALRQLQNFLAPVALEEVIPFDRGCAELAGKIGGEL